MVTTDFQIMIHPPSLFGWTNLYFAPPLSTIVLQELSFMCNHQTTNKHVKFELLDWLYKNKDSEKYGCIYEFDLGSIQLPNLQSLVSQLNFHIDKHVTRLADLNFNVFGYDADTGHTTIHFPHHPKDYYFILRLSLDLCCMVGLVKEGEGKPGSYTIIGLSKPQDKYKIGTEIRYFTEECAPAWPSAESGSNFQTQSRHCAGTHSLLIIGTTPAR